MLIFKIVLIISSLLGLYSFIYCIYLDYSLDNFKFDYFNQHIKDSENLLKVCKQITFLKKKVNKLEREIKKLKERNGELNDKFCFRNER